MSEVMCRVQALPYAAESSLLFSPLAQAPWAVFLDSCHDRNGEGRFDIFSALPRLTLVTRGKLTEINGPAGRRLSHRDPIELLGEALGHPRPAKGAPGLPFNGGAMGYFAYDLGRRFERLPVMADDDIGIPEMAVGIYDWAVVVDHANRRSWLVDAAPDAQNARRLKALFTLPPSASNGRRFKARGNMRTTLEGTAYVRAFERIQHYIREGDCYQVNLARRFSVSVEGDPWSAYLRLRRLNPAPHAGYMNLPFMQVLSSSPERFLRVRQGVVETKPIKGTRPRSGDPREDRRLADTLRHSIKDRAENVMIVDLLRNDLGKNCAIGSVEVPALFEIESFSSVHHLVSTVRGRLAEGKGPLDLLRGCFPGGSITGAPKLRAMEIIEALEPCRRTLYCGAMGYIGFDGSMDTNIAIRTLLHIDGTVHFWAGGGIVADSSVTEEYQECEDKVATIRRLFQGI